MYRKLIKGVRDVHTERGQCLKEVICVLQLLDIDPQDTEEDGAVVDLDAQRKGKCAVIKTSTRQVRVVDAAI